jgi:hypothetical protein
MMSFNMTSALLLIGVFAGMLMSLVIGQRLGRREKDVGTDSGRIQLAAVEAAIFGLMGLMIAFTFSGAAQRYEMRRQLVVDEANAIGTSYLRLDFLPASRQAGLREKYRRYLEARIAVYRPDPHSSRESREETAATLQREIWTGTAAALAEAPPQITIVVVPALNDMIDVTTRRTIAALTHTPKLIMAMLLMLGLVCSLLAGYVIGSSHTRHAGFHWLAFAFMMTITIYVIYDLDYPRYGLIQVEFADQALKDVLANMK